MNVLVTLREHLPHDPLVWVIVIALFLGWLDRQAQLRGLERYDAWWFSHLRESAERFLGRSPRR